MIERITTYIRNIIIEHPVSDEVYIISGIDYMNHELSLPAIFFSVVVLLYTATAAAPLMLSSAVCVL